MIIPFSCIIILLFSDAICFNSSSEKPVVAITTGIFFDEANSKILNVATGIEYRSMVVISELVLLYTIYEDTVYIEFVKDARLDDATMLAKLSEEE